MTGIIVALLFMAFIAIMISENTSAHGFWHQKIKGPTAYAAAGLFAALLALSERILYDIARLLVGSNYDYFDDLRTIVAHSFFIIPVLIVSLIINLNFEKKEKYSLILVPYFFLSIILAMQLALQISVYFSHNHTVFQLYLVLAVLIAFCSCAIYYIQDRFKPEEIEEEKRA